MKRIFKKIILIFWFCASFVFLFNYVLAQEEDEAVEWEDNEEEMESLQPEYNEEEVESLQPEYNESVSSSDNMDTLDENSSSEDDSTGSFADAYEQNLYETYIQHYSKRVAAEEWNNIVGNKDIYVIQPKDTLWDISRVLFGDPNYWPKLWSANPAITNPHLIQPEGSLGFIYGTEGAPPSLNIIQGIAIKQNMKPSSPASPPPPSFLKGKKIVVPSSRKALPIMQNIPSSLSPLYIPSKLDKKSSDLPLSFGRITKPMVSFLYYYMSEEPPYGQGLILGKKDYGSRFHAGQRIILEMRDPANPGQKMIIVRNKGRLISSVRGVRGPFGYQVEVQGEVEVIGRVPDSFDLYEAKVTKSFNPITKGAVVSDKSLIQFDYKSTDLIGSAEAQIIGVPSIGFHEKNIASPYSLVYLNRGLASGVSVGQMYQVKANLSVQRQEKYGYDIKVGEVKIIYAEDRFATGIITGMNHPVRVGDYIVSFSAGLSTTSGYDPFDDMEEEGVGAEDVDFENKSEQVAPTEEEPYEEEDVFEAFE